MSQLPYAGIRIVELSKTVAGRLAGLLFADQGAEVLIGRNAGFEADEHDEFLDRNKYSVAPDASPAFAMTRAREATASVELGFNPVAV